MNVATDKLKNNILKILLYFEEKVQFLWILNWNLKPKISINSRVFFKIADIIKI